MIAIHQQTRFLAGLGEIVNILTAPVVAALAYLAAMEGFMGERLMDERYMGQHMDDQMMNDQMMTQFANHQDMAIFTSIIIAVVAVGFINGGFAVLKVFLKQILTCFFICYCQRWRGHQTKAYYEGYFPKSKRHDLSPIFGQFIKEKLRNR